MLFLIVFLGWRLSYHGVRMLIPFLGLLLNFPVKIGKWIWKVNLARKRTCERRIHFIFNSSLQLKIRENEDVEWNNMLILNTSSSLKKSLLLIYFFLLLIAECDLLERFDHQNRRFSGLRVHHRYSRHVIEVCGCIYR